MKTAKPTSGERLTKECPTYEEQLAFLQTNFNTVVFERDPGLSACRGADAYKAVVPGLCYRIGTENLPISPLGIGKEGALKAMFKELTFVVDCGCTLVFNGQEMRMDPDLRCFVAANAPLNLRN